MAKIDWAKPVETIEDNPRSVRVLCADVDKSCYPVVIAMPSRVDPDDTSFIGSYSVDGIPFNCDHGAKGVMDWPNLRNVPPKMVKREGWLNIYPNKRHGSYGHCMHETRELADQYASTDRVACAHVEWEEPEDA